MAHEPKYLVKTHDVEKVLRPRFNCSSTFSKGSFFNYIDKVRPIIDQLKLNYRKKIFYSALNFLPWEFLLIQILDFEKTKTT